MPLSGSEFLIVNRDLIRIQVLLLLQLSLAHWGGGC